MNDYIIQQLRFFGVAILTGMAGGILLDFFRSIRKGKKQSETLVAIEDIIFWICEAALIFCAVYKFNSGGLRLYFFIGFIIGLLIYIITVSKAIIFVFFKTKRLFFNILKTIYLLVKKIIGYFIFLFEKIEKKRIKFLKKTINCLKKTKKLLKMY